MRFFLKLFKMESNLDSRLRDTSPGPFFEIADQRRENKKTPDPFSPRKNPHQALKKEPYPVRGKALSV